MLAYLVIFANMYESEKVKFVQLWEKKKQLHVREEKEGKAQVLTQLASQHMVVFTAWRASTGCSGFGLVRIMAYQGDLRLLLSVELHTEDTNPQETKFGEDRCLQRSLLT